MFMRCVWVDLVIGFVIRDFKCAAFRLFDRVSLMNEFDKSLYNIAQECSRTPMSPHRRPSTLLEVYCNRQVGQGGQAFRFPDSCPFLCPVARRRVQNGLCILQSALASAFSQM